MKRILRRLVLLALVVAALLTAGCLLSGTFTVSIFADNEIGTDNDGFYWYYVDITEEDAWEDHADDLNNIDAIGFDLWVRNLGATTATGDAYIDDPDDAQIADASELGGATIILEDLSVAPGANHLTYAQSIGQLQNVELIKRLVEGGEFWFYATTPGLGADFVLDSLRVTVTFTASGG